MTIPGALAVSMVDLDSGASLGAAGCSDQLTELLAQFGSAVVRASMETIGILDQGSGQGLEELVISGIQCFHLLRLVPQPPDARQVFIHLALDRSRANLAMARLDLKAIAEWVKGGVDARFSPPVEPAHPKPLAGTDDAPLPGPAAPPERGDPRAPGDALPPLPRRSFSPPVSQDSPSDSAGSGKSSSARIPGARARKPNAETMRRIVRALRALS